MDDDEVFTFTKKIAAPYDLVMQTKQLGRFPLVHFTAGGVATPADAALMTQIGYNFSNCETLGIRLSLLISAVPVGLMNINEGLVGGISTLKM